MNKVKSGFFAATHVTDSTRHVVYNAWHSTDHIPENLALDGVVLATRWVAPQRYLTERHVTDEVFEQHQYLVHYLMTEPVSTVFREFSDLGARTRNLGRFFAERDIVYAGHHRLLKSYPAEVVPISAEAVPFRPHRGVVVMVTDLPDPKHEQEQSQTWDRAVIPAGLHVPGVLGASWFSCTDVVVWTRPRALTGRRDVTVFYVDRDPLAVFHRLLAVTRPLLPDAAFEQAAFERGAGTLTVAFAGPYATIADPEHYDWREDDGRSFDGPAEPHGGDPR
jgi:hypothetical protein